MDLPELDAADAPSGPDVVEGLGVGAGAGVADAASIMEALTRRDRRRDPGPADIETIHERARLAARAAAGVKAEDVRVLDMHELVTYTDYLVLCTGRNVRLTKRIADEVAFRLKQEEGLLPAGTEGAAGGEWILLDYLDFMVHVFTPQARDFYRLDVLWKRAPVEVVES